MAAILVVNPKRVRSELGRPAPLCIDNAQAVPANIPAAQPQQRRKGRKSMSRRSGQSGYLVKQTGWWRVRFRLDQPETDKRIQMSVKVALVSAGLTRSELERRARQIVQDAGANSEERFNQVVLGELTFRQQAKAYLQTATTRNRKPLRDTVSIEGAFNKWIYPTIGDLPLRLVDNLAVKPLVEKMHGTNGEQVRGIHQAGCEVAESSERRTGP
jgi:hypothetical protein